MGDLNELVAVEVERKLSDPAYLQRAVLALTEKIMAKDRQLEVLAEAKGFYDRVTESDDWMEMAAAVKVLAFRGYGRNKTFILLRKNQILRSNNEPYQEYIDRGYFKQVEELFDDCYGRSMVYRKTMVSQKGLEFIRKMIEAA